LPFSYSARDLHPKAKNKEALQHEYGLPLKPSVPLFASIGRMVHQKGIDLLLTGLEMSLHQNVQFVLIGTGEPALQNAFLDLAARFPDRVAVKIGFDEGISHRIEAGADFFLMPSRFEPCGLNQMYSLRFATPPIVRATGGLEDSVTDARDSVALANGIKFKEISAQALAKAIQKALAIYKDPVVMEHYRRNAVAADFSWDKTCGWYEEVYQETASK
jgi:starch synthase